MKIVIYKLDGPPVEIEGHRIRVMCGQDHFEMRNQPRPKDRGFAKDARRGTRSLTFAFLLLRAPSSGSPSTGSTERFARCTK